jgi:hypothetical protein
MSKKRSSLAAKEVGVQEFGGPRSLPKLDIIEKYVNAPRNTLFGPRDDSEDIHAGSASRALDADPPFDRIVLIEQKRSLQIAREADRQISPS